MELGLQVDPAASVGSIFVLGGFAALQLKIRSAIEKREERDAAIETLRKAEVLLLAGKLAPEEVERARQAAQAAKDTYEDTRKIAAIGGALLRIPDPSASAAERRLQDAAQAKEQQQQPPPQPPSPDARRDDPLDGVRAVLRLQKPDAPPSNGSLLPTGSRTLTLKDVAIALVFVLQVGWFALSLTDPMGEPNPMLRAALSSGGDMVDEREARRAAESAEYKAMLQAAVDRGEAPPTCATRRLSEATGGCAGEPSASEYGMP